MGSGVDGSMASYEDELDVSIEESDGILREIMSSSRLMFMTD